MSGWLIGLVGLVYVYVTVEQALKGNMPMAIIYFGYSVANFGFMWSLK